MTKYPKYPKYPWSSMDEFNKFFEVFFASPEWAAGKAQINKDTDWVALEAQIDKDDARENRSRAHMGLRPSEVTKAKIRAALIGRPAPIAKCPHCGKTGGHAAMYRWHFGACKLNSQHHQYGGAK